MIRGLAKFFLEIRNEGEMIQVLHRLFTPGEVVMLGRRLHVADELLKGRSYRQIGEKYKVGLGTIRSIDQWLEQAIRDYDQFRQKKMPIRRDDSLKLSARYIHFTWPLGLLDLILSSLPVSDNKKL